MLRDFVIFLLATTTFIGGYFLGKANQQSLRVPPTAPLAVAPEIPVDPAAAPAAPAPVEKKPHSLPRQRIPVAGVLKGTPDAPITIVAFTDFQCRFCLRAAATIDELLNKYPGKIRYYVRHNPLGHHIHAPLAAEAALAAESEGKFWRMHDLIMEDMDGATRERLEKYALLLDLDATRFKQALDTRVYKVRVDQDQEVARQFGVSGTPMFFINGRRLSGARPLADFQEIVDAELPLAEQLLASGTPANKLYDAILATPANDLPSDRPIAAAPPTTPSDNDQRNFVPVAAVCQGTDDAPITIVEFTDFQCPFCARSAATIEQLLQEYPGKIRFSVRHNPLSFHPDAPLAAEAALAAESQGKSWDMYRKLNDNSRSLTRADLEKYAQEIGLDMAQFNAALDTHAHKQRVNQDIDLASDTGVKGVPCFYINGQLLSGAQPIEAFQAIIDEQLPLAEGLAAIGTSSAKIYDARAATANTENKRR